MMSIPQKQPLSPILPTTNEKIYYTSPSSSPALPSSTNLPLLLSSSSSSSAAAAAATTTTATTTRRSNSSQPSGNTNWKSDTKNFRIQGWDPVLIISQILAIQAIHYLVLSLIIPPLLHLFSDPIPLEYEGGARNVAMIIDWRAMVGRTTLHIQNKDINYQIDHPIVGVTGFGKLPNSLGRKPFRIEKNLPIMNLDSSTKSNHDSIFFASDPSNLTLGKDWIHHNLNYSNLNSLLFYDPIRSWVISIAWFITSLFGVIVLYQVVRRPKQIMDHSLTISAIHIILTTYYSSRLPTSIWFYFVLIFSSIVQIVITEQLCVRREFRDGLGVGWKVDH